MKPTLKEVRATKLEAYKKVTDAIKAYKDTMFKLVNDYEVVAREYEQNGMFQEANVAQNERTACVIATMQTDHIIGLFKELNY